MSWVCLLYSFLITVQLLRKIQIYALIRRFTANGREALFFVPKKKGENMVEVITGEDVRVLAAVHGMLEHRIEQLTNLRELYIPG